MKSEHVPYFDRIVPYSLNAWPDGRRMQFNNGEELTTGICMHSRTVLHYHLDGLFQQFLTTVGLQYPEGQSGNVVVRVIADGNVLFENLQLTGQDEPQEVDVDVTNIDQLILEVDFGEHQDVGDRVVWYAPRLLRDPAHP